MTDQEQYDSIIAFCKQVMVGEIIKTKSYLNNEKIAYKYAINVDVFHKYSTKSKLYWGSDLTFKEFKEVQKFKDQHPEYFI